MTLWLRNVILLVLMLASAGLALALRPTQKIADNGPKVDLEALVPTRFGDWHVDGTISSGVVNPQQTELLNKIYTQTLSRTYINASGDRIMLSIAYGSDQTDGMQVHKPEICYPAQGFQLSSKHRDLLRTDHGNIPVTRLETTLGSRFEPVTYWTTVGETAVTSGIDKKLQEMRYGLTGKIPDGLLFRVSSIEKDSLRAFDTQGVFINQLLDVVGPAGRRRLSGIQN